VAISTRFQEVAMSDQTSTVSRPVWTYTAALVAMTVAAGAGFWMSLTSRELPGTEALTLEDAVDAAALMLFGVLGAALLAKGRAAGMGRALLLMAGMIALDYLLSGLADAIAGGQTRPVAAARLLNMASEAAFVVAFFLFALAPLFLFPTGRLPSRRWRWVAGCAAFGCVVSVLTGLLAPGPVDDDVSAWGENPVGLDALPGLVDGLEVVGMVLLAVGVVAGLAAFVTRWMRYRGPRRRQMAWFTIGVVVQVTGLLTDTSGQSVMVEVLMALAIFGAMLWGIGWPLLGPLGSAAEAPDHLTRERAGSEQAPGTVAHL
jgi:hypothetical protein